jgi:hypothetical protein
MSDPPTIDEGIPQGAFKFGNGVRRMDHHVCKA